MELGAFTRDPCSSSTCFRCVQYQQNLIVSLTEWQIFITSILSALVYSLIFLVLRGTLVIRGGLKFSLDPSERWGGSVQNYHRFVARIARSMLWYVIFAFCTVTLVHIPPGSPLVNGFLLKARFKIFINLDISLHCVAGSLLGDTTSGSLGSRLSLLPSCGSLCVVVHAW